MSNQSPASSDDPNLVENTCLVRFAYHLWRIDTAARALPTNPEIPEFEMMKDRWEIGLVLELVCPPNVADLPVLLTLIACRRIYADMLRMPACWGL